LAGIEKKEKIIQIIRNLLNNNDNDDSQNKGVQVANIVAPKTTKRTFRRHGKVIK